MLTKSDFNQITKIVQKETLAIVRKETPAIVREETTKIVRQEISASEKRINKKLKKIENKLDFAINFLDRENIKLVHRIERIEDHLGLKPAVI